MKPIVFSILLGIGLSVIASTPGAETPLSPAALAATKDGKTIYIACATANQVLRFDVAAGKVAGTYSTPDAPSGLALAPDDSKLFVTCGGSKSVVVLFDNATTQETGRIQAGHTAMAPVVSPDGMTLYVCNRFNNDVSILNIPDKKELRRIPVRREPVAAALTKDGRFLLVANLLHDGRADTGEVAAVVSVLDVVAGKLSKELRLPNGSGSLNDISISPDGKHAVVTHLVSRFTLPATQLERGWMNTNAETIIDLTTMEIINTVLLDSVDSGAANPWGVDWSTDGSKQVVAHAGTHEISIIDFPALLARIAKLPITPTPNAPAYENLASRCQADVVNDLSFLVGLRQRVRLPQTDRGPRAIAIVGSTIYAADYFSDRLSLIDLKDQRLFVKSVTLGPEQPMSVVRKGEFYFHDAGICFQGWHSCASCHPGDARMDALNWDLLNDGTGNPKNNKSLLLVHKTPPSMSLGVRETGEMAVRAGIRHILFTVQPPEVADSMDEYLKSLKPVPSPFLVDGKFSPAAQRGEQVFNKADCADCHKPGLFTDLNQYNVGTRGPFDAASDQFDTPTLIEIWRTAPYLHDGSAVTLREVVTDRNAHNRHGKTTNLSSQEIDDLCAYLNSL